MSKKASSKKSNVIVEEPVWDRKKTTTYAIYTYYEDGLLMAVKIKHKIKE